MNESAFIMKKIGGFFTIFQKVTDAMMICLLKFKCFKVFEAILKCPNHSIYFCSETVIFIVLAQIMKVPNKVITVIWQKFMEL